MRPVLIDDDPIHPSRIDGADANLSMEEGEATPRWVAPKRGAMSTPASVAARAGVPLSRSPLPGNSFAVPQGSDSGRSTPDPLRAFRAKGKAGSWNKDTDKGKLDSFEGKVLAELTRERERISRLPGPLARRAARRLRTRERAARPGSPSWMDSQSGSSVFQGWWRT
jgi:hypothetical protein